MKHVPYYPSRQGDQIVWLENYRNKLPGYGAVVGLAAGAVTASVADGRWLVYVLQSWLPGVRSWAQGATDALTEAQSGSGGSAQGLPVFTAPALPNGVAAVNPGALDRIFAVVQQIKDHAAFTEAIGTDLGIIGSEALGPDLATVQPKLKVVVSGGHVELKWGWEGNGAFLDLLEIQVDRGDGQGFKLLTYDSTPNYTDTQPFPSAPARWSYKAIYRVDDAAVGQWSAPVSVNVG